MKDFEGNEFDGNLYKNQKFYSENVQELINIMEIGSKYTIGACRCIECKGVVDGNDYGFLHRANEFKSCSMYAQEGQYIVDRNKIKEQIFLGNPCWYSDDFNDILYSYKNGYINMDREINSDTILHAVVIIGYDDNKYGGSFRILNSWGENWGENGMGWIRYEDIDTIKGYIHSYGKGNRYDIKLSEMDIKTYFASLEIKPIFKNNSNISIELDTVKAFSECKRYWSSNPFDIYVHNYQQEIINVCNCYIKKLRRIHNVSPLLIEDYTNLSDNKLNADLKAIVYDCWDNLDY